jgi:isopentenyldiphosphate isomerase
MRELKLDLTKENFYFMGKILYKQEGKEHDGFGEFEVDYIYLCKVNEENISFTPVPEEIDAVKWASEEELDTFIKGEI